MTLNNEQRDAVYMNAPKMLCLAGAGCGKTHSMIQRMLRLVNDDGVDPRSMLVLTFTNAAALEMQVRYINAAENKSVTPNFRTFHSFCYSLIATNTAVRSELGYSQVPDIATDADQKRIEKLAAEQCGIKSSASALAKASKFTQDTLRKATRRLLLAENLITFDIMCYDVCRLFVDDARCIHEYKTQYKYIFVDEFQDTDPKQWEFVSSFKDANIFVVADALQAIYAFRGADSSIVKNLADNKEWQKVKLTYNYRSTSQICEFANQHSTHGEESYRVTIHSNKQGPQIYRRHYDEDDTLKEIVRTCNMFHVDNGGTAAILCRTNAEVAQVAEMCKRLHISARTKDADADFTLCVLRSLKDEEYAVNWLASKLKAATYIQYLRRSFVQPMTLNDFQMIFIHQDNLYLKETYEKIRDGQMKLRAIASPADMNNFIGWIGPKRLADMSEIHKRSELIDALIQLYDDTNTSENHEVSTLYVGTIHSVKGLEYDSVMLLNVGGKSFRLTNEENKNLYYVGITRAKEHLYIWEGDLHEESNRYAEIEPEL